MLMTKRAAGFALALLLMLAALFAVVRVIWSEGGYEVPIAGIVVYHYSPPLLNISSIVRDSYYLTSILLRK